MTGRHRRKGPARGVESHVRRAPQPEPETELKVAVAEIERVLDTPLHELLEDSGEQEAAEAAALVQEVREVPAVARFRRLLAFVGKGRPATQAGNLKLADARELVAVLGTRDTVDGEVRSMGDLPDVAHALRWAVSAELLAVRGQRLLPGPLGEALETDPLTAWLKVAFALLENGVLGGFQEGWRPGYVEMLDGSVPGLLVALAGAGQPVALGLVQESAWEDVAGQYGYRKDNERERHRVDVVIEGLVAQLADAGVVARDGDEITLTPLGGVLAGLVDVIAGLGDETRTTSTWSRRTPCRSSRSAASSERTKPSSNWPAGARPAGPRRQPTSCAGPCWSCRSRPLPPWPWRPSPCWLRLGSRLFADCGSTPGCGPSPACGW